MSNFNSSNIPSSPYDPMIPIITVNSYTNPTGHHLLPPPDPAGINHIMASSDPKLIREYLMSDKPWEYKLQRY